MEKRYNDWQYDEEEVRTITEQITESYESGSALWLFFCIRSGL